MTGYLALLLLVQVPAADSIQGGDRYRIVYTVLMNDVYSEYEIYSMNAEGTGVRRLTGDSKYEQCPLFVRISE